ncbi:MAG: primosomal protein N' [Dehalococcoidales bacterium]|nr:primosomal protein N' [Dehalococcoidales bacterium]
MEYAEVSVNSPAARRLAFSYAVPPGLDIEVGQAVWVPFGERKLQGVVLSLSGTPPDIETREIAGLIERRPLLSPHQVSLARWLSEYYLSPFFEAVALMLPPGFKRSLTTYLSASPSLQESDLSSLPQEQKQALDLIRARGRVSLRELEKALGKKQAQLASSQLVRRGLAVRDYELAAARVKPRLEPHLSPAIAPHEIERAIDELRKKRAGKQAALLSFIARQSYPVPWAEARSAVGGTKATADALVSKGLIKVEQIEVRRDPLSRQAATPPSAPLTLTATQKSALERITSALRAGGKPGVFLLHGVTGSGKTEVYLQALAQAVGWGKKGIVLVPEISLTPQTIERFSARFPHRVAVLHSKLSLGEQFDEWQRIRNGECDVVIGPRSAVFAPQPDLGLIIIDEEHEWSYKQPDRAPRYHARDVALKLAELAGATVVLGSATPDVESFYHAQRGDYHLLQLPERVVPNEGSPLPQVEVVDMRKELKAGNRSIFSRALSQATTEAIANREQVMLFLNRRGGATFVQCRNCGYVLRCRRCEVVLTYHLDEDVLACHQCNYRSPVPQVCPRCSSRRIKFLGTGTQKLAQLAQESFPGAKLLRWDSDATREKDAHLKILNRFRNHEADILVGTQMIAKGLDLPLVTLVGVVNADTSLNLPDFRAGERTFQLLSQVLGRAGRGSLGGRVVIQTYFPENYAIQAAARHDYALFYQQEIDYRRQFANPPFRKLACLTYHHTNDTLGQREAERMKQRLTEEIDSQGLDNISLIGPAPAFIHRLRGRFRWQLILRGSGLSSFLAAIPIPPGWTIDIDPVGLT